VRSRRAATHHRSNASASADNTAEVTAARRRFTCRCHSTHTEKAEFSAALRRYRIPRALTVESRGRRAESTETAAAHRERAQGPALARKLPAPRDWSAEQTARSSVASRHWRSARACPVASVNLKATCPSTVAAQRHRSFPITRPIAFRSAPAAVRAAAQRIVANAERVRSATCCWAAILAHSAESALLLQSAARARRRSAARL